MCPHQKTSTDDGTTGSPGPRPTGERQTPSPIQGPSRTVPRVTTRIRLDRRHIRWFGDWSLGVLLARQAYDRSPDSTHRQPQERR